MAIDFSINPQVSAVQVPPVTLKPVHTVEPVYPLMAKQARVQGTVRFAVTVGADGSVCNLHLVAGHPMLVPAVVEAVKQCRFRASSASAKTAVDVNFILKQ